MRAKKMTMEKMMMMRTRTLGFAMVEAGARRRLSSLLYD